MLFSFHHIHAVLLFTFPRKGTETRLSLCGNSDGLYLHHYLHFLVRGRKLVVAILEERPVSTIIIYMSP